MKSQTIATRRWPLFLCLVVGTAIAAGVSIDGRTAGYNTRPNIAGTSINTLYEVRQAGLFQAAAVYRNLNGQSRLPTGSTFTMTWPDGSSERAFIESRILSTGTSPIPGTQSAPGGGDDECPSPTDCIPTDPQ